MKFVIATHNKGKLVEFQRLLEPMGIEAVTMDITEAEETGSAGHLLGTVCPARPAAADGAEEAGGSSRRAAGRPLCQRGVLCVPQWGPGGG